MWQECKFARGLRLLHLTETAGEPSYEVDVRAASVGGWSLPSVMDGGDTVMAGKFIGIYNIIKAEISAASDAPFIC